MIETRRITQVAANGRSNTTRHGTELFRCCGSIYLMVSPGNRDFLAFRPGNLPGFPGFHASKWNCLWGCWAIGGLHIQSIIRIRIIFLSRKGKPMNRRWVAPTSMCHFQQLLQYLLQQRKLQYLTCKMLMFFYTFVHLYPLDSAEPLNNKVDALDPSLLFFFIKTTQPNWSINSRKA